MSHKPLKIVTIIGARPQFIKSATVSRAIEHHNTKIANQRIDEVVVHTGQHYDHSMSQTFFDEFKIAKPDYNLAVGSGKHGYITGVMLGRIEDVIISEAPDWLLTYGDTNSTIAGALAAAKLHIPIAHVEAGLRSYNKTMPEEINRLLTDHISSLLFAPTQTAANNLEKEGIHEGVIKSGDVMYDAFLFHQSIASKESHILSELNIKPVSYSLATVHRQENTDDHHRLSNIFKAFGKICSVKIPLVMPLHPRTLAAIRRNGIESSLDENIKLVEPVGYTDMIQLESNAKIILTDSGGIQKESYFAGVPCVTLRDETEWVETVEAGANYLSGANVEAIEKLFNTAIQIQVEPGGGFYGDGNAALKIVKALLNTPIKKH